MVQGEGYTLYQGNCLEVLPTLGKVDAVITDPPYGVDAAIWDSRAPYEVLPELLRVSSGLVLWFGAAPRLREDLAAFEVPPQRVLIWHVTFSLAGTAAHGMYYRYHPIYAWQLPKEQEGLNQDVIRASQDGHNGWFHPGTKPIELMRRIVRMTQPGDLILDPFMGSGTTGVAALQTGRRFVGVELDSGYFAIAAKRLVDASRAAAGLPKQLSGRVEDYSESPLFAEVA